MKIVFLAEATAYAARLVLQSLLICLRHGRPRLYEAIHARAQTLLQCDRGGGFAQSTKHKSSHLVILVKARARLLYALAYALVAQSLHETYTVNITKEQ